MTETLLDRFRHAYAGAAVDAAAVDAVYRRWISLRSASLGSLPAGLREEVMSGLAGDRVAAISASTAAEKPMQLEYDRIWTELWPVDRHSEALARGVKQGHMLSDGDRAAAEADRARLASVTEGIQKLTPGLRPHFDEVVSETMLDLAFALNNGAGPVSMRLGRED